MKTKFLILSIVIATIFTVTITENLQTVEGLSMSDKRLIYQLNVGESQLLTWTVINDKDEPTILEFYAEGKGSEYLIFEKFVEAAPKEYVRHEIIASIPDNHPDNIEYRLKLFALQKGSLESGVSGVAINVKVLTQPVIKIGDNPVFTAEPIVLLPKVEKPEIIKPKVIEKVEPEIKEGETIEEKLARIAAANEANTLVDTKPETQTSQADIDLPAPTVTPVETKPSSICSTGTMENAHGICVPIKNIDDSQRGGGCLIATAAYGSELAPQVQYLRELRDNTLLSTDAGISFMESFNKVYYTFSPSIADLERESPIFREAVKLTLTPMLSTLSIMTLAEEGSEVQVMGLGISVIALNLAMYLAAPAVIIYRLRK